MRGINLTRVMLGGLLAGMVINVGETVFNAFLFADQLNAAVAEVNVPRVTGGGVAAFFLIGFGLGIAGVWTYAAIRPRFGPGVGTAMWAGAAVWGMSYAYMAATCAALGLFPPRILVMGAAWGLPEIMAATVAGASIYQEGRVNVTV